MARDTLAGPQLALLPMEPDPEHTVEAQLVADVVGRFANNRRPGDRAIAEWAVNLALNSLRSGSSASHACKQGRRVIERWTRLETNLR